MNTLLAIFVCAFIAVVSCAPQDSPMEVKAKCQEESGASEEMVNNAFMGTFSGDPKLAQYFFCVAKRDGVIDDEGHVHKDLLKKKLLMFVADGPAIDVAIDKCLVERATMEESALEAAKCLTTELHQ